MNTASTQKQEFIVAIDGPSGVGKSTIAKFLARKLSYRYIDTGAMYRAVALLAGNKGVSLEDADGLAELGREMQLDNRETSEGVRDILFGEDVTEQIRATGISEQASILSRYPQVREALVEKQREMGKQGGIVMEGRDIGSVVFPDADVKVFLDADAGERAKRRCLQWKEKGMKVEMESLSREITARDQRDQNRKVAPLKVPDGALVIDTTDLCPEEVLEQIMSRVKEKKAIFL